MIVILKSLSLPDLDSIDDEVYISKHKWMETRRDDLVTLLLPVWKSLVTAEHDLSSLGGDHRLVGIIHWYHEGSYPPPVQIGTFETVPLSYCSRAEQFSDCYPEHRLHPCHDWLFFENLLLIGKLMIL